MREPIWTNNPEWQDPETGKTTEAGAAHRYESQMRLHKMGKAPHPDNLNLKETDMSGKFAKKKDATEAKADVKADAKVAKTEKAKKVGKVAKEAKAPKGKAAKETKVAKTEKKEGAGRRSALSDMKIKVLNKAHGAREGTKRAAWFDALVSSKTVAQAQEKIEGLDASVVREAERQGVIKLEA